MPKALLTLIHLRSSQIDMSMIHDETHRPKTLREYVRLYLTGVAMGSADTVPGVSGGTIAFVMGIYGDLLNSIKSVNAHSLRLLLGLKFKALFEYIPWQFILTLGLGILTAVLTLTRLVDWAMEHQQTYLFSLFMGLVIASGIAIIPKVKRWNVVNVVMLVLGISLAYIIVGLVPQENISHDPLTLFLSGMVAITAMILPGISGSSILLVLGQYRFVLNAVKTFDIVSLASLAIGCLVGIMVFSRLLSWLLKRYEQPTIALLIGFVFGSLRAVWPWKAHVVNEAAEAASLNVMPNVASPEFAVSLVFIVIGFLAVSVLDHFASGTNPVFRLFWRRPVAVAPTGD
jgi:putative membrane protein